MSASLGENKERGAVVGWGGVYELIRSSQTQDGPDVLCTKTLEVFKLKSSHINVALNVKKTTFDNITASQCVKYQS